METFRLLTQADVDLSQKRYEVRRVREKKLKREVKERREHRKRRRKYLAEMGSTDEVDQEHLNTLGLGIQQPSRRSLYPEPSHNDASLISRANSLMSNVNVQSAPAVENVEELEAEEEEEVLPPAPDRKLEATRKLPAHLMDQFCIKRLAGKPLVEIDPYYFDKRTFVVVGNDLTIFRFSSTKAFCFFGPFNPLRRLAIYVQVHSLFSLIVLLAIIVNCVFMAVNEQGKSVEYSFTAFYTCEMLIKAFAKGAFMDDFTYLRDVWNWMDFLVVSLSYVMFFIQDAGNFSAFRSLRVLRALKTVTTMPGLKMIVSALLEAIKHLRDIIVLTLFVLSIFALIGLQLYKGTLLRKCVREWQPFGNSSISQEAFYNAMNDTLSAEQPLDSQPILSRSVLFQMFLNHSNISLPTSISDPIEKLEYAFNATSEDFNWAVKFKYYSDKRNWNEPPKVCRNESEVCGPDYRCIQTADGNPNFGYTSFDNFGSALLCTFRLMTQDYWEDLYQIIIRANGQAHIMYFILVIFLGSYYLVNVILAIVAMSYEQVCKQAEEDAEEEEAAKEVERKRYESMTAQNQEPPDTLSLCDPDYKNQTMSCYDWSALPNPLANHFECQSFQGVQVAPKRHSQQYNGPILDFLPIRKCRSDCFLDKDKSVHYPLCDSRLMSNSETQLLSANKSTVEYHLDWSSLRLPYVDETISSSEKISQKSFLKLRPSISATRNDEEFRRVGSNTSFLLLDLDTDFTHVDLPGPEANVKRTHFQSITDQISQTFRDSIKVRRDSFIPIKKSVFVKSLLGHQPPHTNKNETISNIISQGINSTLPIFVDGNRDAQGDILEDNLSVNHARIIREAINSFISPQKAMSRLKHPACCQQVSILSKVKELITFWIADLFCSWECCPAYKGVQRVIGYLILDPFVELFVTICIILNTFLMVLDEPDKSQTRLEILKICNYFFTCTFGLECVLKLIAVGPREYFLDGWNKFDFVVVIFSLIEIPLANIKGLSILRTFRLLRVLKLAKSWQTMNLLFAIICRTMGALGNLTVVLVISIFVFAVVGMSLFGEKYNDYENIKVFPDMNGLKPRWNFSDFTHSFMIVFRVLCGEWIESMWDCLRVCGYTCIAFFLVTMIFGNLVVLNLFLALLLSCFGSESLQRREDDSGEPNKLQIALDRIYKAFVWVRIKLKKVIKMIRNKRRLNRIEEIRPKKTITEMHDLMMSQMKSEMHYTCEKGVQEERKRRNVISINTLMESYQQNTPVNDQFSECSCSHSMENVSEKTSSRIELDPVEVDVEYFDQPDDCFPKFAMKKISFMTKPCLRTPIGRAYIFLRNGSYKIVEHRYFEGFIIAMILISSGTLTLEDKNLPDKPWLKVTLEYLDKYFTIIFTLEMLLKWLAYGLKKFFSDYWCWLDFMIVMIAWTSLILALVNSDGQSGMSSFKAMRTLRALRPLRAVSRWELMRIVVNALFQAIPSIFNVFLVILVFWLIFAIMGMQLFGGKFRACVDSVTGARLDAYAYPNRSLCEEHHMRHGNVTWKNAQINFDNVLNGYLALLQVATFKGWTDIMANAVDIVDIDKQPEYEHNLWNYAYFVLFIICGSFFTLNLFIGVIIDNFNVQKRKAGGSIEMFMTDEQKKYYNAMKKMNNTAPQKPIPRPKVFIARIAFDIVSDQKFDIVIMFLILLNTFIMSIEHQGQTDSFQKTLEFINKLFIFIFIGEFIIKATAQRWHYFKIYWNIFDCGILVSSIIFWAVEDIINDLPISPTFVRIIRLFRIGRVLRLVKSARGIRTLLFSLVVSLPALVNIGVLLFMIMFIYAIVGMSFFGNVKHHAGIDSEFSFETFPKSIIILFQISTSAGWNTVLDGIINEDSKLCDHEKGTCGNYTIGVLYTVSYLIISFLVIVNMYIAVILENFSQATEDVQQGLTQDDFDLFYEIWEDYDFKARGFINLSDLSEFVHRIGAPLGIPKPNQIQLARLAIPICQGDRVFCVDLLDALTRNFLGQIKDSPSKEQAEENVPNPSGKKRPFTKKYLRTERQVSKNNWTGLFS